MSYPVLYASNETNFDTLGIGVLTDSVKALVTEKRNNSFYLELEYPVDGALFNELRNDRLIKCDANANLKDQRFKIIRVTKKSNKMVAIEAQHVSYHADEMQLEPNVDFYGDAEAALVIWKNSLVDDNEFEVFSDIQHEQSGSWSITTLENARQALFGKAGSILHTYGGEYRFDNYRISLYTNRGANNGALIAYGKNLTDLEQDEKIDSTFTSVYPYSLIMHEDGTETLITLPEFYIDSEHVSKYARRKIMRVDFSEEEIDNEDALRARTEQYIESNNIGVPQINLRVKFLDLAQTLDYKHLQLIEKIELCDLVTVYFDKLDVQQTAKVIKTIWNVLMDRYEELELGEARASLAQRVDSVGIDEKIDKVTKYVNTIQNQFNGKNKIYRGPDEPDGSIDLVEGDLWYRPNGSGNVDMFLYTGNTWERQIMDGSGIGGTIDGQTTSLINLIADNIASGMLDLSKGISIGNQSAPVLRVNDSGEVEMNVTRLLINSFDPETDTMRREDFEHYLRYENGIVEIGERNASIKTQFKNDEWSMIRNNEKRMWIDQDAVNILKAHFFEQMQVGNFAFIPRANGSLDFKKVVD